MGPLQFLIALFLGTTAGGPQPQSMMPPAPPAPPNPVEQAKLARDQGSARSYFKLLGEGKIDLERAPKQGVIVRGRDSYEPITLANLKVIFAGCVMRTFRKYQVNTQQNYMSDFDCPKSSQNQHPIAVFKVVGDNVDELRVGFAPAGVRSK